MLAISAIRIVGIILGAAIAFYAVRTLRKSRSERPPFGLVFSIGIIIFSVGLMPDLVNQPAALFGFEEGRYSRLILLSLLSNLALWLVMLRWLGRAQRAESIQSKLSDYLIDTGINQDAETQDFSVISGKPLIAIPALNEAENLEILLPEFAALQKDLGFVILVVDDGSRDGTFETVRKFGYNAVRHPFRRGGGAALRTAYRIAIEYNAACVVTMDADGQHSPDNIKGILDALSQQNADLVIGSRVLGSMENYSQIRSVGVWFFSSMLSTALGQKITDCASGFRGFSKKAIRTLTLFEDQYHTNETIVASIKSNLKIVEVPVAIAARMKGKSKKGATFFYAISFFRSLGRSFLRH